MFAMACGVNKIITPNPKVQTDLSLFLNGCKGSSRPQNQPNIFKNSLSSAPMKTQERTYASPAMLNHLACRQCAKYVIKIF